MSHLEDMSEVTMCIKCLYHVSVSSKIRKDNSHIYVIYVQLPGVHLSIISHLSETFNRTLPVTGTLNSSLV